MSASASLQPLTTSATPSSVQGRTECAFLYDHNDLASSIRSAAGMNMPTLHRRRQKLKLDPAMPAPRMLFIRLLQEIGQLSLLSEHTFFMF
jgi:hypothetical protein